MPDGSPANRPLQTVGRVGRPSGSLSRPPPYALGVLLGPFAGAVARDWQSCCAANSWSIAPYAIGVLVLALVIQLTIRSQARAARIARATLWWIGCSAWFLAAVLSYGHALE